MHPLAWTSRLNAAPISRPATGSRTWRSVPLHFGGGDGVRHSEALDTHRGGGAILMDPPLHYVLVLLKYRVALFDYMTPRGFWRIWSSRIPRGVSTAGSRKICDAPKNRRSPARAPRALYHVGSAVHFDRLSDDVTRGFAQQETIASAISSFVDSRPCGVWRPPAPALHASKNGREVVVYRARTDGVDADAARREFLSEALGQRRHAALDAAYTAAPEPPPVRAAMELRLTIAPPRAAMRGATACVRKNMLFAFRFITSSNSA